MSFAAAALFYELAWFRWAKWPILHPRRSKCYTLHMLDISFLHPACALFTVVSCALQARACIVCSYCCLCFTGHSSRNVSKIWSDRGTYSSRSSCTDSVWCITERGCRTGSNWGSPQHTMHCKQMVTCVSHMYVLMLAWFESTAWSMVWVFRHTQVATSKL